MGRRGVRHHRGRLAWWERLPWFWHRQFDGTRWCRCSRSRDVAALRQQETGYLPRHAEFGLWQVMHPIRGRPRDT